MTWGPKPKKVAYVVLRGRIPGIYESWSECSAQVTGFDGACFKGYEQYESAIEVWNAWEEHGLNRIAKSHSRHRSGKLNEKGKIESRDRLSRIEEYARQLVKEYSGPDGSGSHTYTIP